MTSVLLAEKERTCFNPIFFFFFLKLAHTAFSVTEGRTHDENKTKKKRDKSKTTKSERTTTLTATVVPFREVKCQTTKKKEREKGDK